MTPTDVAGWVRLVPDAFAAAVVLIAITAVLENTERGRRLTDRLIDLVIR